MLFHANIDLNKNELQNARIQNLSADPGTPVNGQVYYNTTSNVLRYYNGTAFQTLSTGSVADATTSVKGIVQLAGDLGGTGTAAAAPVITAGAIDNAKVSASAAIAYSKLNLATSIVNADVSATAAIVYSKLNLATSIVNADINASAAIAYSKLNLTTSIVNGDIAAAAAIAYSKLNLTGAVLNADLAGSIANTKLATDPLARANHTGTQLAATVSNFDTAVRTNRLDQMATPTAPVALGTQKITGLADGTAATDAVNLGQMQIANQGLDAKASVRAATTAAGTLAASFANTSVIDGITLATGDRILIKDQAAGAENGIYTVNATGAPTRATDMDAWAEVPSAFTWVEVGTTNSDSGWTATADAGGTLNTTAIPWVQFSGAGQITAGAGLTKTGNTLDAGGTANRITVAADAIDISTSYVGQASITTLGTIGTGVWNGTAVALANGGTGQTTAKTARETGLSAAGYYSSATHGAGTTIAITQATHGLRATRGIAVQVQNESDGAHEIADFTVAATGDVTVTFATSQTANTKRVTLLG